MQCIHHSFQKHASQYDVIVDIIILFSSNSVPSIGPHNITVDRLNGTAMNVSFVKLSLVEARRLTVTYFITYAPSSSRKRQAGKKTVAVSDGSSHKIITGLDPKIQYTVRMFAAAGSNAGPTSEVLTTAGT